MGRPSLISGCDTDRICWVEARWRDLPSVPRAQVLRTILNFTVETAEHLRPVPPKEQAVRRLSFEIQSASTEEVALSRMWPPGSKLVLLGCYLVATTCYPILQGSNGSNM